jgi:hypothetical protein
VSPVLESLLRSCLSPNVHARPSADHILASLRAFTQAPLYAKAKAWMRMGTDAAALLAKDSERVDQTHGLFRLRCLLRYTPLFLHFLLRHTPCYFLCKKNYCRLQPSSITWSTSATSAVFFKA